MIEKRTCQKGKHAAGTDQHTDRQRTQLQDKVKRPKDSAWLIFAIAFSLTLGYCLIFFFNSLLLHGLNPPIRNLYGFKSTFFLKINILKGFLCITTYTVGNEKGRDLWFGNEKALTSVRKPNIISVLQA